jgi:hypothetical protein
MKKIYIDRGISYSSIGKIPTRVGKNNLESKYNTLTLHSEIRNKIIITF